MKSINSIATILFIILNTNMLLAQSSSEIGLIYSLTSEKLTAKNANASFDAQLFHSFGIHGKTTFESNLFIVSGIHIRRFGTSFSVEETTTQMPEGTGQFFEASWNATSIDIPIQAGYYFLNLPQLRLGIAFGLGNSFLTNQLQTTKGVKSDIDIYSNYMLSLKSNLDIGIKVSDFLIFDILPIWQYQINSNFNDYKQNGLGCQIGISYIMK